MIKNDIAENDIIVKNDAKKNLQNSEEKDKEYKGKTMEIRIVTKRVWKILH